MIVIATGSPALLHACHQHLQRYGTVVAVSNQPSLDGAIARMTARLIFIDHELPGMRAADDVRNVCVKSPLSTVLMTGTRLAAEDRIPFFNAGAQGFFDPELDRDQVASFFKTLERGERWTGGDDSLPRKICRRYDNDSIASRLLHLTFREKEIAMLVGDGHSNATIARKISIAERTVKCHLSEIFRKLEVSDRHSLAMRVVARR